MPRMVHPQTGAEPYPGYRLVGIRGRGAFGEVWEAAAPGDTRVALKFLYCNSNQSAAREIKSLQSIRRLMHPHLIRIDQVWCCERYVVVAMELADCSLAELLDKYMKEAGTPIAPAHACLLLTDAAEGLDFLNARHHLIDDRLVAIQHCDINPRNLLIVGEHLKVSDFSLCSLMGETQESRRRAGTLDYCAPEVFQGRLSSQTDQYALAITYCVLRGGRLPFTDTPENFSRNYFRPAPDLSMLSSKEQPIIARALNPIPQSRWPTCGEMMQALSRIICQAA